MKHAQVLSALHLQRGGEKSIPPKSCKMPAKYILIRQ